MRSWNLWARFDHTVKGIELSNSWAARFTTLQEAGILQPHVAESPAPSQTSCISLKYSVKDTNLSSFASLYHHSLASVPTNADKYIVMLKKTLTNQ